MNGPEHYREAEKLLAQAESAYLDDSDDALPRDQYATDAEWCEALKFADEMHEKGLRLAGWLTAQAQVHATLAAAAASNASARELKRANDTEALR